MYICPICNREFENEEVAAKHLLECWHKEHPYHIAKSAPQSEDINTREINEDVLQFFASFQKE